MLGLGLNLSFAQWQTQPTGIEYTAGNVSTSGVNVLTGNEIRFGGNSKICIYKIDYFDAQGNPKVTYETSPCNELVVGPVISIYPPYTKTGQWISNITYPNQIGYNPTRMVWFGNENISSLNFQVNNGANATGKIFGFASNGNLELNKPSFDSQNQNQPNYMQIGNLAGVNGLSLQSAPNRQISIMPNGSLRFWNGATISPTSTLVGVQGPPGPSSPWVLDGTNMRFSTGKVWIGSRRPTTGIHSNYKLAVDGKIVSNEIFTLPTADAAWADDVFNADYKLKSLVETEAYINKNHHLEGIPSEAEVKTNGIDIGSMDAKLLRKIEEQMLHIIRMQKEIDQLKEEVNRKK